ncbi:predicted protein [Lichtheimia corymbifera JMRC:FSU:9682]|uniref:Uncharacterized protein n=1 Tax=Lichtheimia corymbifera JMRC:FSU:9682 TaxID=1263082 RepID=A0A068S5Y5_9FUNG|nr:predicted protein [Lichtheimia corymbifera JMRC:FSU:9682]
MERGVYNRPKVLVGAKRTLCASFTIKVASPKIRDVTASQKYFGRPLEFSSTRLVVTLGVFEIGDHDHETSTQGALHPAEHLCSIEDPMFHCKV